jgi:hypothetical protein
MVLNLTDRLTRMATLQSPFGQQLRNALLPLLTGIHLIEDRVAETMAEIGIHYRRSSVVSGKTGRVLHAGDRAPDCTLVDGTSHETILLLDRLHKPVHQLLLFAGNSARDAIDLDGHRKLLAGLYAQVMDTLLIVHDKNFAMPGALFDTDGGVHELYEVHPTGVVLIRPDGYIGFRGGRNHIEALQEYLSRLFCR